MACGRAMRPLSAAARGYGGLLSPAEAAAAAQRGGGGARARALWVDVLLLEGGAGGWGLYRQARLAIRYAVGGGGAHRAWAAGGT